MLRLSAGCWLCVGPSVRLWRKQLEVALAKHHRAICRSGPLHLHPSSPRLLSLLPFRFCSLLSLQAASSSPPQFFAAQVRLVRGDLRRPQHVRRDGAAAADQGGAEPGVAIRDENTMLSNKKGCLRDAPSCNNMNSKDYRDFQSSKD